MLSTSPFIVPDELLQLREQLALWTLDDDVVHFSSASNATLARHPLTFFAQLHPDLPSALRLSSRHAREKMGTPWLAVGHLLAQYPYLMLPFRLQASGETSPVYVHSLAEMTQSTDGTRILVAGTCYALRDTLPASDRGPRIRPYVIGVTTMRVFVPVGWLNHSYPGWEDRYAVASSLGLEQPEFLIYVFAGLLAPVSAPLVLPQADLA